MPSSVSPRRIVSLLSLALLAFVSVCSAASPRWTSEQAAAWMKAEPYRAGVNYLPSTASNQLEMWQPATWDPVTIDRELGWAHDLGFNVVRVFLHNLPWREDPAGFIDRVDRFLEIADKHEIKVLLVIFDSCWDPLPRSGPQKPPQPHVHNSRWVQSPGVEILVNGNAHGELKSYVKAMLYRFKDDSRVYGWDLINEPDNPNTSSYSAVETPFKSEYGLILMKEAFQWAREVGPSQPLTVCVWQGEWSPGHTNAVNAYALENSDILSFHSYDTPENTRKRIDSLRGYGRPMICTEYMARPVGSRFETNLPIFKAAGIPAISWGFVSGRSQTIYPWDSWDKTYTAEPPEWFHDVLYADGRPYKPAEVEFLKATLHVSNTPAAAPTR
jgi:hypothetical protein